MKYTSLDKYVGRQVMCEGKENTLFRYEAMLSYTEKSVQEHPHEQCADALGDWLHIIREFVSDCKKRIDIEFLFSIIIYKSNILHTT